MKVRPNYRDRYFPCFNFETENDNNQCPNFETERHFFCFIVKPYDDVQAYYDPHIRTETAWSTPRDRDWLKTLIENVSVLIPKFKVVMLNYDIIVITLIKVCTVHT